MEQIEWATSAAFCTDYFEGRRPDGVLTNASLNTSCIFIEHVKLPAKQLDCFLRSHKSNINQCMYLLQTHISDFKESTNRLEGGLNVGHSRREEHHKSIFLALRAATPKMKS